MPLRISSPTTTFRDPIPEKSNRQYEATLVDHNGSPLGPALVTAITLLLIDVETGIVIRYFDNVLNQNGGSLSANGKFVMVFNQGDTELLSAVDGDYVPGEKQERIATFSVDYIGGHENHEIRFFVQDLQYAG